VKAKALVPAASLRYVAWLVGILLGLYGLIYMPHEAGGVAARLLQGYLEATAEASCALLRVLGEQVQIRETTVTGRFAYVVVLDCAALDAQSLFAAAVLAFPAPWWARAAGVFAGSCTIFLLNVARLVGLYFAGASSQDLFQVLHEEVLVFVLIALVCASFLLWLRWAQGAAPFSARASDDARPLGAEGA
jgi:exosortase/archaeosortase family protein